MMPSDHYRQWMEQIMSHKVPTKDFGTCLRTADAMHYIRLHGGTSIVEGDGGVAFTARDERVTLTPIFLNRVGWVYPIRQMDDALYQHDGKA